MGGEPFPSRPIAPRTAATALGLLLAALPATPAPARVLSDEDRAVVARIAPHYVEVVTDVSQAARRADLAADDGDCIRTTLAALTQIANELKSYESLITIEGELKDFGDDEAVKGVVRFAVGNALTILETERRRLGSISDQCARTTLALDKARKALQFIENTKTILQSVQNKL